MKRRDVIQEIEQLGWTLKRQGAKHEVWTNGSDTQPIPRHKEINENTAKGILRFCREHPGKLFTERNKK